MITRLAWRNLWRQRRRSLITATAMAIAVALCMAMLCFNDGMYSKLFNVMVEQQLGHLQVHHPDYPTGRKLFDTVPESGETLSAIRETEGVIAAAGQLNGFALIGGEEESVGGQLVGIEPAAERIVTRSNERIVTGRFLADEPAEEIVLGAGLAEDIGVKLGDQVVVVTQDAFGGLGNSLYTVVGTFKTGNTALDKSGSMMHLADLQTLLSLPEQVHKITVLGDDASDLVPLKDAVMKGVPDGTEVLTWEEASPQTAQLMGMQSFASAIVLGIVFAVASFGVLNTMLMSVFERTRELGLLKAVGMRPGRMMGLIIVESVFLAGLAGAIGLTIGAGLDAYLVTYGLDMSGGNPDGFSFSGVTLDPVMYGQVRPMAIVTVLCALVVVSVLASLWPAWRATRLEPVEALRAE